MDKLIAMNGTGMKSMDVSKTQDVWEWLESKPYTEQENFYATVAAAFRAFNLKANTVASVPFLLYDANGEEFDDSNKWENKVKFLPNPQELLRLATLSYITSNAIYHLRTTDALGYKVKGLYHALPTSFTPYVNPTTNQLEYVERWVGAQMERYTPDDKRLVRMWRLDHTTEVLPSPHTEAKAIMKSAGIMHYQDAWVEHFYQGGGVKPTLIGMRGLIDPATKEEKEKSWSNWLRGIGKSFGRAARIYNTEAIDVKTIGAGVDDLKDNNIYTQAIANIAMGTGMPLSLLLANSSNYATAQEEKATWYESDIIPFCRWLAYGYNEQVFKPLGLTMQFQPQTLDPNQQDETEKASAIGTYMDIIAKCPTMEMFMGLADTIGIEISDTLEDALEKYYAEKEKPVEVVPPVQDATTQEPPTQEPVTPEPTTDAPVEQPEDMPEDDTEEDAPMKWIPSLDQLKELGVWRDVAIRRWKKGESLVFDYQPHYGGLPDDVSSKIKRELVDIQEWNPTIKIENIKAAFELQDETPQVKASEIIMLAQAINKLAEMNDKVRA